MMCAFSSGSYALIPQRKVPVLGQGAGLALALLLFFFLLSGCASSWQGASAQQILLKVKATPDANKGRIFYMLVRASSEKQFLTDSYPDIAALVFAEPRDPNVLGVYSIIPGRTAEFSVPMPDKSPVALYFLFTEPSENWNHLLGMPLKPSYEILIQDHSVVLDEHSPGNVFCCPFFGG
jgi:hypothetical protein